MDGNTDTLVRLAKVSSGPHSHSNWAWALMYILPGMQYLQEKEGQM
jgi:hypothetical protein